jgi:hypothetical protein
MPFVIRAASLDDAEAIADCHKDAVKRKAAAFYGADLIDEWSWSPNRISRIRSEIQNRDFIYLVASSDDCILGYGIANPLAFELKSLCARPNKIGRVGAIVLSSLLSQCRKQGCAYLDLSSSLNAEKFYLDNGFQALERGQHIMESGLVMECIKMRIDLTS